jgi:hypothetical protein
VVGQLTATKKPPAEGVGELEMAFGSPETAVEPGPLPAALAANTVQEYVVPLASPATVAHPSGNGKPL